MDLDRTRRWSLTAATWWGKAAYLLRREGKGTSNPAQQWLVGYEAERLLIRTLDDAETLVELLNAEQTADVEERARALAKALKDRRLSYTMLEVAGRTPEESEAFMKKAASLRDR